MPRRSAQSRTAPAASVAVRDPGTPARSCSPWWSPSPGARRTRRTRRRCPHRARQRPRESARDPRPARPRPRPGRAPSPPATRRRRRPARAAGEAGRCQPSTSPRPPLTGNAPKRSRGERPAHRRPAACWRPRRFGVRAVLAPAPLRHHRPPAFRVDGRNGAMIANGFVIGKDYCTYTILILRREEMLRDHARTRCIGWALRDVSARAASLVEPRHAGILTRRD
jgi:hypothetical protein